MEQNYDKHRRGTATALIFGKLNKKVFNQLAHSKWDKKCNFVGECKTIFLKKILKYSGLVHINCLPAFFATETFS